MGVCIWLVALFTFSSALQDDVDVASMNEYLDEVLENLRKNQELVSQFDPFKVPNYHGDKVEFTNMVVRGLSFLHRSGDSVIMHKDGTVIITAHLAVNDIHLDGNYAVHVLFGWLRGEIAATLSRAAVKMVISSVVETGVKKIEHFSVTDFGDITITKATGITWFEWLLRWIAQIIVNMNKGSIRDALEHNARNALEKMIESFEFP